MYGLVCFLGPFFGGRYCYVCFSDEETEAQRGQGTAQGPSPWYSDTGLWLLFTCCESRHFLQLHSLRVENLSTSWCRLYDIWWCHRRLLVPQCPAIHHPLKLTWAGNESLADWGSLPQAPRAPWSRGLPSITTAFLATRSHSTSREREFLHLLEAYSIEVKHRAY